MINGMRAEQSACRYVIIDRLKNFNNLYIAYSVGVCETPLYVFYWIKRDHHQQPSSYQTQDRKIHPSHHCFIAYIGNIQYCQHYHNTYLSLHIMLHHQSSIYDRINLMQTQDQFHDLTLPAFLCTQYSVHLTLSKALLCIDIYSEFGNIVLLLPSSKIFWNSVLEMY